MEIFFSTLLVIIVYLIKESFSEAKEQKTIAIQINSYLKQTITEILNTKQKDLIFLMEIGIDLHNKEQNFLRKNDLDSFRQVMIDFEEKIEELKIKLSTDKDVQTNLKKYFEVIKNLSDEEYQYNRKSLSDTKSNLLLGKSFVSEEDASKISWGMTMRVIRLKSYLNAIISSMEKFTIQMRQAKEYSPDIAEQSQPEIVINVMRFGKELTPALKETDIIINKTISSLCILNIQKYFQNKF